MSDPTDTPPSKHERIALTLLQATTVFIGVVIILIGLGIGFFHYIFESAMIGTGGLTIGFFFWDGRQFFLVGGLICLAPFLLSLGRR